MTSQQCSVDLSTVFSVARLPRKCKVIVQQSKILNTDSNSAFGNNRNYWWGLFYAKRKSLQIKSVLQYHMYHLINLSYFQYPSNWYWTTHKLCSILLSCCEKDLRSTYYIHVVSIFVTQLHNRDATRQNMISTMLLNVKDVFVKRRCLLCQWSPKCLI